MIPCIVASGTYRLHSSPHAPPWPIQPVPQSMIGYSTARRHRTGQSYLKSANSTPIRNTCNERPLQAGAPDDHHKVALAAHGPYERITRR